MKTAQKITLLLSALLLAACGGGGSASSSAPGGNPQHTPAPPPQSASGAPQTVHRVIGFSQRIATESVPGNDAPALPAGFTDGGVVAHAVIIYPDGSTQIADGNGVYYPAQAPYATKYSTQLRRNPQLQPFVVLTDPSGTALPSTATVSAYTNAEAEEKRFVHATKIMARRLSNASGSVENIAGVQLLPSTAAVVSGNLLNLDAVGVDTNDSVLDISHAQISWKAQYGSVYAFPNSSQAYYLAPDVSTGSTTDTVTVSVTLDGVTVFTAASTVTVASAASSATVSGTITANGNPVPGGIALFAQASLPQAFAPDYWLGQADASGNYTAMLPASSLFALGVGGAANGAFGLYVGADANGNTSYQSTAAGNTDSLNLILPSPAVPFSMLPPALSNALPSYVTFVRDAWYATNSFYRRVFEASSGIQPLIASPPSPLDAPYPANPVPVGSGQLAEWCYQWQPMSGVPTLVLIENTDASCSQPGNEAYTVNADPAGGYDYVHYLSVTPYATAGTPDVITGSLLVESGIWTQSIITDSNGHIQSDLANVQSQIYDKADQVFGQPVYNESLQYQYSIGSNGYSTAQFSNDQRTSAYDGSTVATLNGTKTQLASYGSCQGTPSACHTISASIQEDGLDYTIDGTQNGDGSSSYTYRNSSAGDSTKIAVSPVSDAASNAQGCMVCAASPGEIFGTDGTTPIGTFTINNAGLVQASIYDTPPGSTVLGPDVIDSLGFIL